MGAERSSLIQEYARALLTIASAEGELGLVEDQLYALSKAIDAEPGLRDALADPDLPAENKKALLRDIMGEAANPVAVNALAFLVEQGRGRDVGEIAEAFARAAAESRQHVLAEVRSAVPMDEPQRKRLGQALSRATGKTVEVKVVVDPTVVGGIVARVGDEVFDGTVRNRLQEARRQLAGA
ncbi:MAG TPA: ATP synthase F1 subunit delta [Actinomycetota bacterium]|nr:ATP synthase F1 subunit delta [Actinomycetota bacterium]